MNKKIVLSGGAGLVGQNLVIHLKESGYENIVVIDKHCSNLETLGQVHPDITVEYADLAQSGTWQDHFIGAHAVVMLQAQIGGNNYQEFQHNNIDSTKLIIKAVKRYEVPRLIHISSSVVESVADDFYTRSKTEQEEIVLASGLSCPILRPTLMFGWFDRKHLGWLSRFMRKLPVFPIPGHGRYVRQPLYVGDFCHIIIRCIEAPDKNGIYNISGLEKIDYIDIIRQIKSVIRSGTIIIRIPYRLFYGLLWIWALFDKQPPFTTQQLEALTAKDEFEIIDWPGIFDVPSTPFHQAVDATFNDDRYSHIALEF